CRPKRAPLFNRAADRWNAGLSRGQSSIGHDATRPRIDFDRSRREIARGSLTFAGLFARDRTDVWNVPTHAGEGFHRGDDPENDEPDMHDRGDDGPEKYQNAADARNGAENRMHDRGNDIEQKPRQAKDDRLHRIETHERVVFFQDKKNDAADQRNA